MPFLLAISFMLPTACSQGHEEPPQEGKPVVTGPAVGEPVKPGVSEESASKLPPAKTYRPGEPVEVMPDLRESPSGPPSPKEPLEKQEKKPQ